MNKNDKIITSGGNRYTVLDIYNEGCISMLNVRVHLKHGDRTEKVPEMAFYDTEPLARNRPAVPMFDIVDEFPVYNDWDDE